MQNSTNHRGFTLIELLTAIAILGVLATIAIPIYKEYKEQTRIAAAQVDIKNIVTAFSTIFIEDVGFPTIPGAPNNGNSNSSNFSGLSERLPGLASDFYDPWGNPYLVDGCANTCNAQDDPQPWGVSVCSRGPNGEWNGSVNNAPPPDSDDLCFYFYNSVTSWSYYS